ncbi:AAA family ATPase [Nostoc sp. FACHB-87]|uniref:KAP family NTPase n=1 Tax=Nostocaceae TaxID=1162 RepID=UPI00168213F7|nr:MULTISPECIES: KAP family P-loop domain protein [Nostocaceae]MBD2459205.1 AAA family ATPase [Nostoc sp. FACHB-87]MBD2480243.1 AAA family ATPase [Anabaena sp. FACHB-83]
MFEVQDSFSLEPNTLNTLSADKPLSDPKDDKLGYAPFAKNLAESISKMSPPDGLVIAVYAPWGSGKSTLLNFIIHYLKQKPEPEQPVIVPYNPWWFSGQEDLTKSFFEQLLGVLYEKWQTLGRKIKNQIGSLAERVSTIPDLRTKAFAATVKTVISPKDIHKLKEEIEKILKKQQKRILIVIDDIDRLTAEEIRQLFRVIKAVANFPNVVYLLLFDKEVVVKALEETQKINGEVYLEKIVQVSFELPLPDKLQLTRLFDSQLTKIISDTPEELFQPKYWTDIYWQGIEHFINTPRSVLRLINTLMVTYPGVKGEVNFVDFVAIETIRLFCPTVYNIIRNNPDLFTFGLRFLTLSSISMNENKIKEFHTNWINQIKEKDRNAIKFIVTKIFPKAGNTNVVWGDSYLKDKRRYLHICSADIFPVYFRLAVPEGDISISEMQSVLALANNSQMFGAKLVELSDQIRFDGISRIRVFLDRLRDYVNKDIPLDCIESVLQAFFEVGDQLWNVEDEKNSFASIGNEYEIEFLINQLLERIEKTKRDQILKKVILNGHAIATIVNQMVSLGSQHGKYEDRRDKPEDQRILNTQQLEGIEKLALNKVREAAQEETLLTVPKLRRILAFWRDSGNVEEVSQWVKTVIQEDQKLIYLLENFLSVVQGYRLDPQWLSSYLSTDDIITRVQDLAKQSQLTENQKIALNQFIKEYKMRQQGENPNHPFP